SEEHTSELQSHLNLVCRLLLEKKIRSEEHTSELQSHLNLVCRLLIEKKNWLYKGDQSYIDENVCFYFVDRKNDMIKRAADNVSSFFLMIGRPPRSTLFPYTTLSR